MFKNLNKLIEDYASIFSIYSQFKSELNSNDNEILIPKYYNSFKLLIELFNNGGITLDAFSNNSNIIFSIYNVVNLLSTRLEAHKAEIASEFELITSVNNKYQDMIINLLYSNIIGSTKFNESLTKLVSHEQAISLLENILEKCIYAIIIS